MKQWLQWGGETGALIASIDWAATRVGAIDVWPTSLRTMLSTILQSRFPLALYWTRSLIMFYNDAFRPLLGDRHPRAMGRSAADTWRESWEVFGPKAQLILDGGPATWDEDLSLFVDRKGFLEKTYWTFSCSPVPDDGGAVVGVLVAVQETTGQVRGERQLEMLRSGAKASPGVPDERDAGPRGRVLLADANADMRARVRRLLEAHWDVQAVEDGEAALAALERTPFDLVLMDVMMPRLDGYGLLRRLREHPAWRATPVIIVSARASDEARVEGLEAGADGYLVKPFGARELLARVSAQIELSRLRRTAESERRKLDLLLTLGDELRPLGDPAAIPAATSRVLVRDLAVDRAVYADLDGDAGAAAEHPPEVMAALRDGRSVRVSGPRAWEVVIPLLRQGHLAASLAVHSTTPRAFGADDLALLREAAERTRDHVERARAETAQRVLAAERETLLREIHHRVKNNLEVVDSLLHLQADAIPDERLRAAFAETSHRIHAIAESHRLLHGAADLANVDLKAYAEALSRSLSSVFLTAAKSVRAVVDAEPLMLDLRRAIAVGLILNELISNAFKHAFPGRRDGTVVIRIARDGDVFEIGVSDDGVGMPDPIPTATLGLRLVRILTEQVRGSLRFGGSTGTSVVVRFAVVPPAPATPDGPGR